MPSNKRIAFCVSEKKFQKLNWQELETISKKYGFEVFKLSLKKTLESQGPFCVLVHKMTDIIASANMGDIRCASIIQEIETFISQNPSLVVIDPIVNVRRLIDRCNCYSIIHSTNLATYDVFTPNFCTLRSGDRESLKQQLKMAKVTYPFICKPILGHGSKKAHEMSIIFNEKFLSDIRTPCVAQSFINHGAVLFKIYIAGEKHCYVERPSLKNFQASERETIYFDTSDVSKADSKSRLCVLDPEDVIAEKPKPNEEIIDIIATTLRKAFGMDLLGVDMVVDKITGKCAIIDVNAYPGTNSGQMMPSEGPPSTPSSKSKEKNVPRTKVVVALYNYKAIESGDLSLEKNQSYDVIDDSQEHWWKVKDSKGNTGYIPSNYVKEKESLGLQQYEWYVNDMSRQRAESLLKHEDKEGCFVVRNSSTKGLYTLSLYTKIPHTHVKHYHIKLNARGEYFLSEKHCCSSIPDLINYHKHNSGGLASRLKTSPCDRPAPATAGLSHDKWEIDPNELMLLEELGSGQFGVVRRGKWRGSIDVAVKMMKEGTMSEDDFIEEAKVMTKLQHNNLVQLYGVCSKDRPIYIVTEYMRYGSLLNHLRRHEQSLSINQGLLLDMCIQVCKGMAYLERHNYIHRDLAARNCLVGTENTVKVADFGLARYVLDDQYTSSGGSKFPIKWAPPEVLNYTRFSSKSDVWAYGVLMWEVFTCGKIPYGRLKNTEVVECVQKCIILEKPKACYKDVYDVMRKCWSPLPENRPSFKILKETLINVSQGLLAD